MEVAVTKSQLQELNEHRGQLDTDSGQVFVGFVGRLHTDDGLYHGELNLTEPTTGESYERFNLVHVLDGRPEPIEFSPGEEE